MFTEKCRCLTLGMVHVSVLGFRQNMKSYLLLAVLMLTAIWETGCVRRRLTVRTNPPGAMVYVDRQPIGRTPVSDNFTFYGTRHFEIVKDGYRTESFLRTFRPPWYEIPPLDFVSETLWPFEKRDERVVDVQMVAEPTVPTESLIASAEGLRLQASQGIAVVPSANTPVLPSRPGMPSDCYPAPPVSSTYVDPTLPGPDTLLPGLPGGTNGPGSVLPGSTNAGPGTFLPDLLTPSPSMPLLNITPGNSYRPVSPSPAVTPSTSPGR